MLYVALVIKKIEQYIVSVDGVLDYRGWVVVFSWKELQQFLYDANEPMRNATEIDTIDNNYVDELENAFRVVGLELIREQAPTIIFLYKRRL